jgi:hypothetical protein
MNLILYLRRLPGLGIYIVMIVEIFRTFAMFFLPFMLFIIAFAMSFYLLFANQVRLLPSLVLYQIGTFDFYRTPFPRRSFPLCVPL